MANAGTPDNLNGDCSPVPDAGPLPTQVTPLDAGVSNGTFLMRSMLGTCILDQGGQVVFNPPLDPTMSTNPDAGADAGPTTFTIQILAADGNECGVATYTTPDSWSITIDSFADAGPDAGLADGGTYTQSVAPGTEELSVSCPTGESHLLNLNELAGPPGANGNPSSSCPGFAALLPSASLQMNFGGINVNGAVSFAISYPPTPAQATYPSSSDLLLNFTPALEPTTVVYFNCVVPAAPELCADGVKDGTETDVDCGGPQIPSTDMCGMCPPPCEAMQACICNADCDINAGLVCVVNPTMGTRQCTDPTTLPPNTPTFPHCAWDVDAGPPCSSSTSSTSSSSSSSSGAGGADAGNDAGPTDAGTD